MPGTSSFRVAISDLDGASTAISSAAMEQRRLEVEFPSIHLQHLKESPQLGFGIEADGLFVISADYCRYLQR